MLQVDRKKLATSNDKSGKASLIRHSPKYKFGYQVPNNHGEAMLLDKKNFNSKWADAEEKERELVSVSVRSSRTLGRMGGLLMATKVYDVKHDGQHRVCMVAAGHLTEVPIESIYSGVVSLRGIRLMIFLAELNQIEAWGTDISSAYLTVNAFTKEKLFMKAGPEFGDQEGHILLVEKALYRLRTSGVWWHERLTNCLRRMVSFLARQSPTSGCEKRLTTGDTSRSGSNSSHSCSGREKRGSCLRRSITRKSTMASLSGETLPTKVVAIEPILGSIEYEARSHYHSVLEEIVGIQEFRSAVSRVHLCMSERS